MSKRAAWFLLSAASIVRPKCDGVKGAPLNCNVIPIGGENCHLLVLIRGLLLWLTAQLSSVCSFSLYARNHHSRSRITKSGSLKRLLDQIGIPKETICPLPRIAGEGPPTLCVDSFDLALGDLQGNSVNAFIHSTWCDVFISYSGWKHCWTAFECAIRNGLMWKQRDAYFRLELCGCVSTHALHTDGTRLHRLSFVEQDCIQCGLSWKEACPENVLTLTPRMNWVKRRTSEGCCDSWKKAAECFTLS